MQVGELTEVIQTFDPAKDGYNKRAVKEACKLLRTIPRLMKLHETGAHVQAPEAQMPGITFRGKTYVQTPGEYLYVFAARDHPAIKIGRSIAPEARIATLEGQLHLLLEPVLLLPEMGFLENAIHHIFWDYRIAGEWFSYDLTLKRWVEEIRPSGVVVTRYELAAQLAERRKAASRVYPAEPIAA